jgi:hypothetical protein
VKAAALALVALAALPACDPIWGAHVRVRDPSNRPVEKATVAVACADESAPGSLALTDQRGEGSVGSIGTRFPVGCDLYIAKQGHETRRIRYRELCPGGPNHCERWFDFDLVLPHQP